MLMQPGNSWFSKHTDPGSSIQCAHVFPIQLFAFDLSSVLFLCSYVFISNIVKFQGSVERDKPRQMSPPTISS